MWTTRLIWTAGIVTWASGCASSHAMQQHFDDGSCPARYLASSSAGQPEVDARSLLTWSGPTVTRDIDKNNGI